MDRHHGYAIMVIGKGQVWHLSTMNDETVHNTGYGNGRYVTFDVAVEQAKGLCTLCFRFLEKHGDYQGYDESNGGRMFSITNPKPVDADIQRKEGVKRIMDKVNAKKGFPKATPQNTSDTFIGSGALDWPWWDGMNPTWPTWDIIPDDWSLIGVAGYEEDFSEIVTINHESILKAIRAIANLKSDEKGRNTKYVSRVVVKECQTWIFKGPDWCDFDAPMADEVMQFAAFGCVVYA